MTLRTHWLDYLEALEVELHRIDLGLTYHPMSVEPMADVVEERRPEGEIPEELRDRVVAVLEDLHRLTVKVEAEMVDVAARLANTHATPTSGEPRPVFFDARV